MGGCSPDFCRYYLTSTHITMTKRGSATSADPLRHERPQSRQQVDGQAWRRTLTRHAVGFDDLRDQVSERAMIDRAPTSGSIARKQKALPMGGAGSFHDRQVFLCLDAFGDNDRRQTQSQTDDAQKAVFAARCPPPRMQERFVDLDDIDLHVEAEETGG